MNKMEHALHELSEMEELAARISPVHGLHPTAKLIGTVSYILVTLSFGKYDLDGLIPMLLWPVSLFQLGGIDLRICFHKLRFVLPLVMAVGLFNPFFDRKILLTVGGLAISCGMVSMLTLMLKGVFCLMASFLLMATTRIDSLCAALRELHIPKPLVTLLLLTFRYAGMMTEELSVMSEAYRLRAPGQTGIHISAWGSFLGQLLLRSMDRAQELYASMLLRGYQEEFHYAQIRPFSVKDALFLAACGFIFFILRFADVSQTLGRIFVG